MTADEVQDWLDAYIAAWAATPRPRSWRSSPKDEPGSWEAEYRVFAVDGSRAVGVGETFYPHENRRYANNARGEASASPVS